MSLAKKSFKLFFSVIFTSLVLNHIFVGIVKTIRHILLTNAIYKGFLHHDAFGRYTTNVSAHDVKMIILLFPLFPPPNL